MNNYFTNSTGNQKPNAKLFSGNPWPQNLYTCMLALFSTHLELKLHFNANVTDTEWKPIVKYVAITLKCKAQQNFISNRDGPAKST